MMLLSWVTAFLCVSANTVTGDVVVRRDPGENVTLECSDSKCSTSISGFKTMYLYHGLNPPEEVLTYYSSGYEKITPRIRYINRVKTEGYLRNHTITITNLVGNDSGIYRCVYKNPSNHDVLCNVYILIISGKVTHSRPEEEPQHHVDEKSPSLVLVIIVTCAISILATVIFILLILKLRRWTRSRRSARSEPNDMYVYEVMTKRRSVPAASPRNFT